MEDSAKQNFIERYIGAYNNFDVDGMLAGLHNDVVFKNITNGEINLQTDGIEAFRSQAEQAKAFFSERTQTITSIRFGESQTEVDIDYIAILAIDLPNGMKIGDKLELKGKSIFRFSDGKIIDIQDIS
jgi:ketosteroid isomerase-like protein